MRSCFLPIEDWILLAAEHIGMSTIACSNMNAFCMQEYESKVVQHPTFNRIEHLSSWFTKLKYSTIQAKEK